MCGGVCGVEGVWREGCFSLWECVVVGSGGVWLAGKGALLRYTLYPKRPENLHLQAFLTRGIQKMMPLFFYQHFWIPKMLFLDIADNLLLVKIESKKSLPLLHTYLSHTNCSPVNLIHVRNQIFYHLLHLFQHLPHLLHSHSEKHPSLHTPSTPHTPPHIL